MDSASPNIDGLRQLYLESAIAKAFFDRIAHRERGQSETKVDRIRYLLKGQGHEFHRREIIELFRKLEEQGCGQFVPGRRGWPSRFVWSSEMTSIGRAAAGEQHGVDKIATEENGAEAEYEATDLAEPEVTNVASNGDASMNWYEDGGESADQSEIKEYDITASPNDFNILTLHSFIESGAVKIPGFQRNFVWDLKRASKLIESVIIGLPVPQIFLYEEGRNKFLVIDGQQRMMSLYYFIKGRFPRRDKRVELREIFDQDSKVPESILEDGTFFSKFRLQLPHQPPGPPNKLNGLTYETLEEYKTIFDLRTIRNVIIKQNLPEGDDSSIFEIFNRLNSGGMNLTPQEIRISLYHSRFYEMLQKVNLDTGWRRILELPQPDLHMKDLEIVLRGFAMFMEGQNYRPSMAGFLNRFSSQCRTIPDERLVELKDLFERFVDSCSALPPRAFYGKLSGKFNVLLFESVFAAQARALRDGTGKQLQTSRVEGLKEDRQFVEATQKSTTDKANVSLRLQRAREVITG
ncbi:MAG: DUF262 domain-containing protein [Candidatus Micrarchaeaceae archaeon]